MLKVDTTGDNKLKTALMRFFFMRNQVMVEVVPSFSLSIAMSIVGTDDVLDW